MQSSIEGNFSTGQRPKSSNRIFIILLTTAVSLVMVYFLLAELISSKTQFDVADKENPKIVAMLNTQLQKNIDKHEKNTFHPGYLPTAKAYVAAYLKTIAKLESYSRYGVASSRGRNAIEVRIAFKDGTVAEKLYTGNTSSHVMPPPLLLSVTMNDGIAVKVWTNGVEKKGSPEWIVNDLNTLIEAAVFYDIKRNRNGYYPADKTPQDFEKEWE